MRKAFLAVMERSVAKLLKVENVLDSRYFILDTLAGDHRLVRWHSHDGLGCLAGFETRSAGV